MTLPTDRMKVLAIVPPAAATTAQTSSYIKPSLYFSLAALTLVGDASATGTLTLIKAADTSGGSSASVATAAYGGTGTVGDSTVVMFNAGQADDFMDSTRPYFALGLGGGVANAGALLLGFDPRYGGTNVTGASVSR